MAEACPLCGSPASREVFGRLRPRAARATGKHTEDLFGRAGKLVRCTTCGLVRQVDPPVAPYEDASDAEYMSEEAGIRQTFRSALESLERWRRPPGRLLDVGCGPGFLLEEAKRRGWEACGIEPSASAAAEARRRGFNVKVGTLDETGHPPASFDAIVAADVVEHVPDPVAFAETVALLLKPGGAIFIATPDVDSLAARVLRRWWWSVIPNHLWLFSRTTLDMLLRRARLVPVAYATHPKTFSVDYYAGRFGGYADPLGKITRAGAKALGGKKRLVTPDFRDRIAAIAIKSAMRAQ